MLNENYRESAPRSMGCLNMHDKHLKVNKSGGSSISPITHFQLHLYFPRPK